MILMKSNYRNYFYDEWDITKETWLGIEYKVQLIYLQKAK